MISGLTWPNQWNPFEIAPMAMGLTFTSLQSPILYFLSGLGIDQLSPVLSQWPWCQMDMKHRHFTNTTFFFEDYIWLRMIQSFVILDLHVLENFPLVFLNHCSSSLFISHFCIFWFAFPAKLPVQCLCYLMSSEFVLFLGKIFTLWYRVQSPPLVLHIVCGGEMFFLSTWCLIVLVLIVLELISMYPLWPFSSHHFLSSFCEEGEDRTWKSG